MFVTDKIDERAYNGQLQEIRADLDAKETLLNETEATTDDDTTALFDFADYAINHAPDV